MIIALLAKPNLVFVIATAMVIHGRIMTPAMKYGKIINLISL